MVITFWGTRGSIPVPGESTIKYGGNTPCVHILTDEGRNIIIDAGTGIRGLGKELKENSSNELDLFISHTHWDHIHGLPFFAPLYNPKTILNIHLHDNFSPNKIIETQLHSSFFPIDKDELTANIKYVSIDIAKVIKIGNVEVRTVKVHHSKGTVAFKFTENGKSVVYMTDNEIFCEQESNDKKPDKILELNSSLIDFCFNSDYLIHDSMYNHDDFIKKKGWGHSDNISLAYFSMYAKVKNLVLFHYEPDYKDLEIEKLGFETQQLIKEKKSKIKCITSFEGMKINTKGIK